MKYKMPLLKFTNQLVPEVDWSNTLVIACQHLLESTYLYLQKIIDSGLPAKQLYLLGKSYSSCDDIISDFKKLGVYVHPDSQAYNSHQTFDLQFSKSISNFFIEVLKQENISDYQKVVIIDEGGQLLNYAQQHLNPVTNVVGVEQTCNHIDGITTQNAKFPIINIARSQAKLIFEAPFIADALLSNLADYLKQQAEPKSIVVIGNNYLSQQIFAKLKFQYDVNHIEVNQPLSELEPDLYSDLIAQADIIISAVNQAVLTTEQYQLFKPDVILVNAGASDDEFDSVNLRKLAPSSDDVHQHVRVEVNNKAITLFNQGFAANFDGSWQRIPLHQIQLTISLLYCAICLAHQGKLPAGISCIDEQIQQQLIEEFQRMLTN